MSSPKFAPLPPIIVEVVPPNGIDGEPAKPIGATFDGKVLYRRKWFKQTTVPELDNDGNQAWARHPTTGEKTYPRFVPHVEYFDQDLWLEDDHKGSLLIHAYTPPDPAELERIEDEKKAVAMQAELARALVAEGLTPADLISGLRKSKHATAAPEKPKGAPEFPKRAIGGWKLSDGSIVAGKKADAEKAEAALHAPAF